MKLLIIAWMLAAMGASTPAQQTYEIRCRGGAGLSVKSTAGDYAPKGRTMHMTLKFAGGPMRQKIGPDGTRLNVGQCSWVDRDLRRGEPSEIHFEMLESNPDRQLYPSSVTDDTLTEIAPDAYLLPRYLWSTDHFWSFWAYNTNRGYLQATRTSVFKPALQRKGIDIIHK